MEERTRLNKELEAIYKYRSRAVHEGTLPDNVTVNGENVPMGQFIKRSQDLFKRCLLKVIESHQLPDWRTIELGPVHTKQPEFDTIQVWKLQKLSTNA